MRLLPLWLPMVEVCPLECCNRQCCCNFRSKTELLSRCHLLVTPDSVQLQTGNYCSVWRQVVPSVRMSVPSSGLSARRNSGGTVLVCSSSVNHNCCCCCTLLRRRRTNTQRKIHCMLRTFETVSSARQHSGMLARWHARTLARWHTAQHSFAVAGTLESLW